MTTLQTQVHQLNSTLRGLVGDGLTQWFERYNPNPSQAFSIYTGTLGYAVGQLLAIGVNPDQVLPAMTILCSNYLVEDPQPIIQIQRLTPPLPALAALQVAQVALRGAKIEADLGLDALVSLIIELLGTLGDIYEAAEATGASEEDPR